MSKPKVSIIIPVFNVEDYLSLCIESAINQDYPYKELIIINDGSTDKSVDIINRYKRKYSFITLTNIENRGPSVARNMGMDLAQGDFIIFLDSDDYILPNTLTKCIETLEEFNADIVLFSAASFYSPNEKTISPKINYNRPKSIVNKPIELNKLFQNMIFTNQFSVSACLYMFKKNKFNMLRFYPGILHEDNLFTAQLLLESSNSLGVCISDKLYMRRLRPNSITTQNKTIKHLESYLIVIAKLIELRIKNLDTQTLKALNLFIQKIIVGTLFTNQKILKSERKEFLGIKMLFSLIRGFEHIKLSTLFFCIFPSTLPLLKHYNSKK